jgi:fimbrial chaperone protein
MRALAALALGLFLAAAPVAAQPSGVQVSPILVSVAPENGLASVRLRNWRHAETAFEATLYAWRQEEGRDVLTVADDVVIAPSVFAIAAGAEQIVRIAAPRPDADIERAYRLILREIAPADARESGLRVQLQFSLPVFATPAGADAALVLRDGALVNEGRAHARLIRVASDGEEVQAPRYLLAGAQVALPYARGVEITYRAGADDALRAFAHGPDAHAPQASVR